MSAWSSPSRIVRSTPRRISSPVSATRAWRFSITSRGFLWVIRSSPFALSRLRRRRGIPCDIDQLGDADFAALEQVADPDLVEERVDPGPERVPHGPDRTVVRRVAALGADRVLPAVDLERRALGRLDDILDRDLGRRACQLEAPAHPAH